VSGAYSLEVGYTLARHILLPAPEVAAVGRVDIAAGNRNPGERGPG
jgi:hypothetical protein